MNPAGLVEDFYRHEYGHLVAVLSCRVGIQHIETIEDAAQSALLSAFETWSRSGLPENPAAWIFRVAHNNVMQAYWLLGEEENDLRGKER